MKETATLTLKIILIHHSGVRLGNLAVAINEQSERHVYHPKLVSQIATTNYDGIVQLVLHKKWLHRFPAIPDGSFMPHEQCPMGDVLTGKVLGIHDGEVHIERPDGSRVVVIVNIAPLRDDRGEVIGAINCFYDVTERRKTEEALRLANEELESDVQKRTASLRRLSIQLMRSQDEERRRTARNLHDSLGQYLASIKMSLESLSSDPPDRDVLSATLKSVEQCISETRTLSSLLHPPLLDEVGFSSAARWYTDEFAKRSGIKAELELPDEGIERLAELVRIALFRILQESLTNVHRHSASLSVEVRMKVNHQAVLTVRDFGRGMPAELIQGSQTNGEHFGVGMSGMRERVNDLGGTFEIQSSGNGTLITVSIPVAPHTPVAGTSVRKNIYHGERSSIAGF